MERIDGKLVLECEAVRETKRFRKYQLPEELFDAEDGDVLFSSKHVYVRKGGENEDVKEVVFALVDGKEPVSGLVR